jgi:sucrose-6-phosphate hydrolase SacC (GH32 family)
MCYDLADKTFTYLDFKIPAEPDDDGRLRFQILVDRTSLELFVGGGRVSASFCCLPGAHDVPLEFYARKGQIRFVSLIVHELESAWTSQGEEFL